MSDSQLHQSTQAPDHPSPESLTINSSTEGEAEGDGEATQQFPPAGKRNSQKTTTHKAPRARETVVVTATIRTADVHVGPCQCTAPLKSRNQPTKDLDCRPRLQTSRHGAQGRGTYALKFNQLMAEMWELLARSRAFFTKPHSLQRPGRPVTMSTYSKAEERILCKSLHCLSLSLHSC